MPFGTFWKHHVWSEDGSGYIFGQLNKKLATFLIHYLVTLIICLLISKGDTNKRDSLTTFKKNWPASFSLFSCFRQVTVKHVQCKNLPITGFKPLTTVIEKTHTVNYVTTTAPAQREREQYLTLIIAQWNEQLHPTPEIPRSMPTKFKMLMDPYRSQQQAGLLTTTESKQA